MYFSSPSLPLCIFKLRKHMCLSVEWLTIVIKPSLFISILIKVMQNQQAIFYCHAKACWGDEAVAAANDTWDVMAACDALANHKGVDGSITAVFQCIGKGGVTYSHCQHTRAKAQYIPLLIMKTDIWYFISVEFVHWVCKSNWPFQIINDWAFHSLMKTGQPGYYIPSAKTLSCNVKNVFVCVHKHISTKLKVNTDSTKRHQ